jgi:uncharacterized protein YprB with RNaseH-like and TPR domain
VRTCVFDIETFTLAADTGILLCCAYHEYSRPEKPTVIRADTLPGWENKRSDSRPICEKILSELRDFDIFIAHNGMRFDRPFLTSLALKHNLPMFIRFAKFIDPVELARRHLRLSRNSLASVLDFLDVPTKKTDIEWDHWRKAAYDGSHDAMDYICEHCSRDVMALEQAHEKMRKLVKDINDKGSAW